MRILLVALFLLMGCDFLTAQKIDNTISYRNIDSEAYFRFNYDNDYFTATDKNYTQGYSFEWVSPQLKSNPINKLLIHPSSYSVKYGIAIEHIGFTPRSISSENIQLGDRPFASAIMLKSFVMVRDTARKTRLVSMLNIGIIGPAAFGKEMQVGIHQATGNIIPLGWHNQIKNDVVLNYEVNYEKQLLNYRNVIVLRSNSNLRIGTLFSNASLGFNVMLGKVNSTYSTSNRKFQLYVFSHPFVTVVGYDATLQGGLFNDKSPYIIANNELERFTLQYNYGVVLQTKKLYIEYLRAIITPEFKTGKTAQYGGIKFGVKF